MLFIDRENLKFYLDASFLRVDWQMGREKPLNVKMPSLSWPLTLPVRSLPAMRYNWGQRQQSITNTRMHRNWVRQSSCTFFELIVIKFKCKYMYMFNKVLWTKSRLYAKIWKLFVYYPLKIKLLLWFFISFVRGPGSCRENHHIQKI